MSGVLLWRKFVYFFQLKQSGTTRKAVEISDKQEIKRNEISWKVSCFFVIYSATGPGSAYEGAAW